MSTKYEAALQAESREFDEGHRQDIVRALEDLVCRAQRQVIRSKQTASRSSATDTDRRSHQFDTDIAKVLGFVLCSRKDAMGAMVEFVDAVADSPARSFRLVEITHLAGSRA
jgi:hypothetical protein